MVAAPTPPDAARFFTTDPQYGALLDHNGDTVADDLRVRLVVQGKPTAAEWIELIDLAARLGLETGGLTLPLASSSSEALSPEAAILVFQAAGTDEPVPPDARWMLRGASAVRSLCRADLGSEEPSPTAQQNTAEITTPFDLGQLYETGGGLADDDGDLFPERVRLCPIIPPQLPVSIGLALLDLAARLGLETTGIRFPLAIIAGATMPPDSLALTFALNADGEGDASAQGSPTLTPGAGRCLVSEDDAGVPCLQLHGDGVGIAAVLRELAATWPTLYHWESSAPTSTDLAMQLTSSLLGEDASGRAAILAADLAAYAHAAAANEIGGEIRLLIAEPDLATAARAAIAAHNLPLTVTTAPSDRVAFSEEWTAEWEVNRARSIVRERVLPLLDPATAAEIMVMVSEPTAIRQEFARELASLAFPVGSTVHVLSAFKPGLCWLLEVVAPRWATRNDVQRVEIHFRRFEAPADHTFLDLPIRALQELFPGDELLAAHLDLPLAAIALLESTTLDNTYRAVAFDAAGRQLDVLEFSPQSYHRQYVTGYPEEGMVTVTTGAIRATHGGRVIFAERLPTDLDLIWDHYQQEILPQVRAAITTATGGAIVPELQPFFDALEIDAWISETDESLGVREELLSAAEALHQDFYFGTLDAIAALGNATPASGTLNGGGGGALDAPGTIRPSVHVRPGTGPRLRVTLRRRLRHLAEVVMSDTASRTPLGLLPTGKRPRIVVRWVGARAGTAGISTIGLDVLGGEPRTAAIVRALAARPASADSLTVEVSAASETTTLALPFPAALPRPAAPEETLALPAIALAEADLAPYLAQLASLPGVGVRQIGRSFEGRALAAIELTAPLGKQIWSRRKASLHKPTLLIIARHHANEPASTHAVLDLAASYATDPARRAIRDRVNIAILPLENADGAALHAAMRQEHPTWKHHAARYNAVGREFARDYYDAETPWGEARARPRLWREWLPDVVVDNHGVPSHEWNQHFNGFGSPPRFSVSYWLVSALLYGILRYPTGDPAHAAFAEVARDRIAAAVADDAEIFAANQQIRDIYERWGYQRLPERFPATYHREMLWYFGPQSAEARARFSRPDSYDRVTVADIVTEVPDETAQGDYLALVTRAHLVANEALLALLADLAPTVERTVTNTPTGPWLILHRQRPLRPQ